MGAELIQEQEAQAQAQAQEAQQMSTIKNLYRVKSA